MTFSIFFLKDLQWPRHAGHGKSDKPLDGQYTKEYLEQFILDFMNKMKLKKKLIWHAMIWEPWVD